MCHSPAVVCMWGEGSKKLSGNVEDEGKRKKKDTETAEIRRTQADGQGGSLLQKYNAFIPCLKAANHTIELLLRTTSSPERRSFSYHL